MSGNWAGWRESYPYFDIQNVCGAIVTARGGRPPSSSTLQYLCLSVLHEFSGKNIDTPKKQPDNIDPYLRPLYLRPLPSKGHSDMSSQQAARETVTKSCKFRLGMQTDIQRWANLHWKPFFPPGKTRDVWLPPAHISQRQSTELITLAQILSVPAFQTPCFRSVWRLGGSE